MTFKIQADTAAEFESFQNREVAMIYPQPQPDVIEQIEAGLEDAESVYSAVTGNLEGIWMNNASPPLDDVASARRSRTRSTATRSSSSSSARSASSSRCRRRTRRSSPSTPTPRRSPTTTLDLDKVDELMTGAGWAKNGDGIWAKDGQAADLVDQDARPGTRAVS